MRIGGLAHEMFRQPKDTHAKFVARLKALARLRDVAPLAAQEGEVRRIVGGRSVEARARIVPVMEGEKAVVHFRAPRPALDALGLSETQMERLRAALKKKSGLIAVVGPRASGLTTTLLACVKEARAAGQAAVTIEDPIEEDLPGVAQAEVDAASGRTFAALARAAAVEGSGLLMIGDLRDEATAAIAVAAAKRRPVLIGLRGSGALDAIPRLSELGIDPTIARATLALSVGQRLARIICPRCRRAEKTTKAQALSSGWPRPLVARLFAAKEAIALARGAKCEACRYTGFRGAIGIFELFDPKDPGSLTPFFEDGLRKALTGLTTIEELLR